MEQHKANTGMNPPPPAHNMSGGAQIPSHGNPMGQQMPQRPMHPAYTMPRPAHAASVPAAVPPKSPQLANTQSVSKAPSGDVTTTKLPTSNANLQQKMPASISVTQAMQHTEISVQHNSQVLLAQASSMQKEQFVPSTQVSSLKPDLPPLTQASPVKANLPYTQPSLAKSGLPSVPAQAPVHTDEPMDQQKFQQFVEQHRLESNLIDEISEQKKKMATDLHTPSTENKPTLPSSPVKSLVASTKPVTTVSPSKPSPTMVQPAGPGPQQTKPPGVETSNSQKLQTTATVSQSKPSPITSSPVKSQSTLPATVKALSDTAVAAVVSQYKQTTISPNQVQKMTPQAVSQASIKAVSSVPSTIVSTPPGLSITPVKPNIQASQAVQSSSVAATPATVKPLQSVPQTKTEQKFPVKPGPPPLKPLDPTKVSYSVPASKLFVSSAKINESDKLIAELQAKAASLSSSNESLTKAATKLSPSGVPKKETDVSKLSQRLMEAKQQSPPKPVTVEKQKTEVSSVVQSASEASEKKSVTLPTPKITPPVRPVAAKTPRKKVTHKSKVTDSDSEAGASSKSLREPAQKRAHSPDEGKRKSQRAKMPTFSYQSPIPDALFKPRRSSVDKSATSPRLTVFFRNEYIAVRNAEGTFYLCQLAQNVYKHTKKLKIRWLSPQEADKKATTYVPDYYDITDFDCILTNVNLRKVGKQLYRLPEDEERRILNILQRAMDVEKGLIKDMDLSLYKDESQVMKDKKTPKRRRKRKLEDSSEESGVGSAVEDEDEDESEKKPKRTKRTKSKETRVSARTSVMRTTTPARSHNIAASSQDTKIGRSSRSRGPPQTKPAADQKTSKPAAARGRPPAEVKTVKPTSVGQNKTIPQARKVTGKLLANQSAVSKRSASPNVNKPAAVAAQVRSASPSVAKVAAAAQKRSASPLVNKAAVAKGRSASPSVHKAVNAQSKTAGNLARAPAAVRGKAAGAGKAKGVPAPAAPQGKPATKVKQASSSAEETKTKVVKSATRRVRK